MFHLPRKLQMDPEMGHETYFTLTSSSTYSDIYLSGLLTEDTESASLRPGLLNNSGLQAVGRKADSKNSDEKSLA